MPGSEQSISVVMPVHNAMPHLDEAVRSILDQTHSQFEFVILDDGSSDGSTERLRGWAAKDDRIRLVEGGRNLGPVGSSNRVVELASHDLIARMDADDVSLPTRLEEQLRMLRQQPGIDMVACACDVIGAGARRSAGRTCGASLANPGSSPLLTGQCFSGESCSGRPEAIATNAHSGRTRTCSCACSLCPASGSPRSRGRFIGCAILPSAPASPRTRSVSSAPSTSCIDPSID